MALDVADRIGPTPAPPAPSPDPGGAPEDDPDAHLGRDPEVLERVLAPGVGIAIWQRSGAPALARELAGLPSDPFSDLRATLSPDALPDRLGDTLGRLLAAAGADPGALPHWIADLAGLTERFLALAAALPAPRPVTLRLETLTQDGCRRFHVDRTRLRLLCTYRGPGTEWLARRQVDRAALDNHLPNEAIARGGTARRLQPFWVGVMKGADFPGEEGGGQVHRSPPIAGTGAIRLLACLDT